MPKTLEERYTREEILKIALIHQTYDFGYSPVVFLNPYGVRLGVDDNYYDLKALYLLKIWQEAKKRTDDKFFFWNYYYWYYNPDDYFQKLIFYKNEGYRKKAIHYFWEILEKIADSGEITVQESFTQNDKEKTWVINSMGINKNKDYELMLQEAKKNPIKKSWKWTEVKDFFIQLSDTEMELLHGKHLDQCCTRDLPLFDACKRLDITGIKDALSSGAVVNAMDKTGDGCLHYVLDQDRFVDYNFPNPKSSSDNKKIKDIIDFLLDNGLNINLYGFGGGEDSIVLTHWLRNIDLMQFVINRGADAKLNPFCTDFGDDIECLTMSGVYDFVETDLAIGEDDPEILLAEEKILEDAGVKYWIDGWDGDKVSKFYDDLWNKIIYD